MSTDNEKKNNDVAKPEKGFFKEKKKLSALEEEQVQSPMRTILKNFVSKKLAMLGVFVYLIIFLSCMIMPIFFPADFTASDSTQMNIQPGFTFMNVPDALKNNAKYIDAGANYGAGIDKNGSLYMWGNLSAKLK